ncbi:MAG TPA: malto-oligosyltrehalose trehalohydrolase [Gemmatimonadaceae bacterium]|nr:malto-oligosyltrehalose trehalohydrolase [Gemmatimonadaceae bacterium]
MGRRLFVERVVQGSLNRGATVRSGGSAEFRVWAPHHSRMAVRVSRGSVWQEHPMRREGDDWVAHVAEVPAGARYAYVLPNGVLRPDPASRRQPDGVHEPSAVVDPAAFSWTDSGWRGLEMADLVIYELHIGTFTGERTFDGVVRQLPRLRALGITAIEIMPVAAFPGSRNWGYDGVALYAVHEAYGGPDGLRRLVDAAHAEGLAVLMDVVYNHFGPEGNYLDDFGPYFTDTYATPWGRAVNYDGADSEAVRQYVVDNARMWIEEYHCDGLRLDAVHAIYDFSARHLLRDISDAVHELGTSLNRKTLVIAESDMNDPRIVRQAPVEGYGCDGQWSDDFHHAVHAALTGERNGYYADFGGVEAVAAALRHPFVYAGQRSEYRRRRHGARADDVPFQRFVVCIQNHDQVGNRAMGDRLDALVTFEQRKLAAALLLLAPYVPLLFMGEEYGERRPFQYFVSHGDPELVRAVREGRRREFAAFGWEAEVPDPQDERTFERSTIDPSVADSGAHAQLLALYHRLLKVRRGEPALRPGEAEVLVDTEPGEDWIRMRLTTPGARSLVAVFNLAGGPRVVPVGANSWTSLVATEEAAFGGRCTGSRLEKGTGGESMARLAPYAAELFGAQP